MDNVQPRARFAGKQGGALDGLDFGENGTRFQKGPHITAACLADAARESGGDLFALGVYRDGQAASGGNAHAFEQREVVGAGKFRESRVAQECFEADHAARGEFLQVR